MAGSSSPAGRRWPSQPLSSPGQQRRSEFLSDDRNNALSHREALDAALAEHMRINATALQALSIYEDEQEGKRLKQLEDEILAKQRREEERLRKERKLREEQERLRALEEQSVPKLPPKPVPQPAPQQQQQQQQPPPKPAAQPERPPNGTTGALGQSDPTGGTATAAKSSLFGHATTAPASGAAKVAPTPVNGQTVSASPFGSKPAVAPAANPFAAAAPTPAVPAQPAKPPAAPEQDRYVQIHKNLKRLRASLVEQAKTNAALKSTMGDMRREIRKSLGQLTSTKGANRKQVEKIKAVLTAALNGTPTSAPVDPSDYVVGRRDPVENALHNEEQLPSLFLYLVNQLGKGIINQFINECGAAPRAADPLGVVTAQLFSIKEFMWRGKSLIDILMAKFRVVCPVIFGYRGSDKTEQGRARLGWWKDGGAWISEQQHTDRMMGLGVGYASIALRDFSRSPNVNPWPPSHFWRSMASIVNTPPDEISDTQCVVLKALLAMHEDKFIGFYGSAALAAMRKALVDFPNSAPKKTSGVMGLQVLAQVYKRDLGLDLGV